MDARRRFQLVNLGLFVVAVAHAFATWPRRDVLALFAGGMAIAFVLEVVGVRAGLLEHAITPQVAGVPVTVVLVWPAVVYVFYQLALLVAPAGLEAAFLAAVLATLFDLLTDPVGVRDGVWSYPESPVSTPRFYGVPWWNFVAWLVIVFATAMLPTLLA